MLIFEGPDNSGKSTLASYISYQLGIPVHHFGKAPKDSNELENRIKFMFYYRDTYIFDRIPLISEPIYSLIRHDNLMMGIEKRDEYYRSLREVNPILIYCRPPNKVILDGHHQKKYDSVDHFKKVEDHKKILIDRYDHIIEAARMPPYIPYDYTTQEHDIILNTIREGIKLRGCYKQYKTINTERN